MLISTQHYMSSRPKLHTSNSFVCVYVSVFYAYIYIYIKCYYIYKYNIKE